MATLGSTLLSLDRVRLNEVRRTELFIEPGKQVSNCHSARLRWRFEEEDDDGELRVCKERWISASWPPDARSV